jgi:hypothetical protein
LNGTYPLIYNMWAFNTDMGEGDITLDLCGCMDDGLGRGLTVSCETAAGEARGDESRAVRCMATARKQIC